MSDRAMPGLGTCWETVGRDNRDIRMRVGGHDNCDIHTHARSRRVADG